VYEVEKATCNGAVTHTRVYYPAGGAFRVDGTLYYVLKDHLGSASVVTNASGTTVGEDRFYPFGETRFTTGTMYTDKLFTGQREMEGLGIYHFNARFYSPKLGRFLSADTIVPGYANPQNLNRFSYVRNNPLRYTDPTGHWIDEGGGFATNKTKNGRLRIVSGSRVGNSDGDGVFVPPPFTEVENGDGDHHEFDITVNAGNITIELNYELYNPIFWAHVYETSAVGAATFALGIAATAAATSTCAAGPECALLVGITVTFATVPLVAGGLALVGVGVYEGMHHVEENLHITITPLPMNRP